ncbi:DegT/DnrJ/EryC1/StrS family aminotransferase [Candidatus Bathyarchaeota archaeon]|nr:DegT/DnrJ/EryC1/StrS family aminotransferase [Candidatus Bathyarchaeota archaeon]
MASGEDEKLAILGGPKAVTIEDPEQWKRPIEEEKKAVCELIERGELSGSGFGVSKQFEEEFREYIGCEYCLTVDHGTTALASAYYAVGVGPGDEIITPTAGYIGSYAGALHMGARPVFCDIDPKTLLMDPEDVERRITKRTKAINVIHMGGRVCDMDALIDIARKHGLAIVEDACHAPGAEWDGKKIGNVGDITCFSLQGINPHGKPVSGGEGGIVCTNNRELYERQLIYCHLHRAGVTKELTNPAYRLFDSEVLGLKYRAHPLALALARISLKSLPYRNKRMRENRAKIFSELRKLPGLEPVHDYEKANPGGFYGGFKVIYKPEELGGLPIEKFIEAMRAEGAPIRARMVSSSGPGLEHLHNIFIKGFDLWGHNRGPLGGEWCGLPPFKGYKKGDFPVAEKMMNRVLTLPALIDPKEGFLEQYIKAFKKVTSNYESLLQK